MYGFKEILGYQKIVNHLQDSILNNKISHAYIIEGDQGMGKKLVSNSFAKALQCEGGKNDACNICMSCKMVEGKSHPDIILVSPENKSRLGVDDIREKVNKDINIKPYRYPYKIYIIENADKMTVQAQNALLKTIEEPPKYAVIILMAENKNSFLKTIISRCVLVQLKPIENNLIREYLIHQIKIPDYKANIIAGFARGNIGIAKQMSGSEEFNELRESVEKIINILGTDNELEIFNIINIFEENKDNIQELINLFVTYLRDILIIKEMRTDEYIINKDKYKTLLKHGDTLSYNRVCELINRSIEFTKNINANINFQLSVEMMLLK